MPNYNNFAGTYQPMNQYNNGYQMPYPPQYTPYNITTTANPSYQVNNYQSNNGGMVWVQGESGAKSYIVPNGQTMVLWDSEDQVIYIKSVDQQGKPQMTILEYHERDVSNKKDEKPVEYVTLEQFDKINSKNTEAINDLTAQLSDMRQKLSDFKPFASNNRKGNNNAKSSV